MIYEYEACVLKHVNAAVPEVKMASYAKEIDMFGSMAQVKELPSLLYYREPQNWEFPKTFQFLDQEQRKYARFNPVEQKYIGRIYVARQGDALKVASDLRFYWNTHSYVNVPWNEQYLRVALRLLYIKVDSERTSVDKKGPMQFVELGWQSQLFFDNIDKSQVQALVEEVHIHISNDGVKVINGSNLITIVK